MMNNTYTRIYNYQETANLTIRNMVVLYTTRLICIYFTNNTYLIVAIDDNILELTPTYNIGDYEEIELGLITSEEFKERENKRALSAKQWQEKFERNQYEQLKKKFGDNTI